MSPPPEPPERASRPGPLDTFRYTGRALRLVWETSPRLSVVLALLTLVDDRDFKRSAHSSNLT